MTPVGREQAGQARLALAQRLVRPAPLDEVCGLAHVKREAVAVLVAQAVGRPEMHRHHAQRVAVMADQGRGEHRAVARLPCHGAQRRVPLVGLHVLDHDRGARAKGARTGGVIFEAGFAHVVEEGRPEALLRHDP
jgi:hypothetical protein